jgi:hypothetical protein
VEGERQLECLPVPVVPGIVLDSLELGLGLLGHRDRDPMREVRQQVL